MERKPVLSDILAERYASSEMVKIWSPERKIVLERELWIAILKAQRDLGRAIPESAIQSYEQAVDHIDLASIAARELKLQQDVKARIEEFNALAGGLELIHAGMTSRDDTDNVEQFQIHQSLKLVLNRTVAVLARLARRAMEYQTLDICGRTHNVPAQTTTLGKRFAMFAEELLCPFERLETLISSYPFRGIKGAVGTQQDMTDLLGSARNAGALEDAILKHLGIERIFIAVGQVYPRSLDFEVVATLAQLASAPANCAKTIRLMAGLGLMHEGFKEGQTGSTAMPHKMNSRTCERINALMIILGGFLEMTKCLLGDQWNEGDVSCSAVRRIALPGAFFALDGIYESILTVLDEMEIFPAMIKRELETYLPFLSSSRILMAAVKTGMPREQTHEIIKRHATESLREGTPETFIDRLARDTDFPLDRETISELVAKPDHGRAVEQTVDVFNIISGYVFNKYSDVAIYKYKPEPIR